MVRFFKLIERPLAEDFFILRPWCCRLLPMVKLVEVWCRNLSETWAQIKQWKGHLICLASEKVSEIHRNHTANHCFIQRSNFLHEEYHSTFHCAALKARSCATEVDQRSCLFQHLALTSNLEWSGLIWVHLDDLSEIFSRIPQKIRRSKIIWQPIPWVYGFPNATPQLWWGLLRSLWTIQAYCTDAFTRICFIWYVRISISTETSWTARIARIQVHVSKLWLCYRLL